MFFRFLLVVLILQSSIVGCDRITPEQLVSKAEQAFSDGKARSAILHLKSALQQQPDNPRARWLLSEIYLSLGDGASAEKELVRARGLGVSEDAVLPSIAKAQLLQYNDGSVLELEPKSTLSASSAAELAAAQAIAASRGGDSTESLRLLNRAKRLAPDVQYVVFADAIVAYAEKHNDRALTTVTDLLEVSPKFAPGWTLKGDIHRDQLQYEPAEKAYTQAIELQASPVREIILRGLMRLALKEFAGAKADAQLALKAGRVRPEALYLNGLVAFHENDFDLAQGFLERAHDGDRSHFQTRILLAATDFRLGNVARATLLAESAVGENPGHVPTRKLLTVLYLRERNGISAERMIRPVVEQRPDDLDAKNLLAVSLVLQGRPEEASPLLSEVALKRSESPVAQLLSGLGKLQTGETGKGISLLEEAAKLAPGDTVVQTALVSELVKQEAIEDAIETARQFAESSDEPTAYILLANAYLASGQKSDAERVLQQVLGKDEGNRIASTQLSELMISRGELDLARDILTKSLEVFPNDTSLMLRLAAVHDRSGQSEIAAGLLRRASEADASLIVPRVLLARNLLINGRPERALAMLSGVDVQNDPVGLMIKADIYTALDRIGDARIELERLAILLPKSADVQYRLAVANDALNDPNGVRAAVARALELDDSHERALIANARLLAIDGRIDEAVAILSDSSMDPNTFEVLAAKVFISRLAEDYESEVTHALEFHRRFASSSSVLGVARALERARASGEGIAILKDWLEMHPSDVDVLSELARLYRKSGDIDSLIETLEEILANDRDNARALNNLAWQMRSKDQPRALQLAREAFKLSSDKIAVVDTYLTILIEAKEYSTALDISDTAIDLSYPSYDYHVTKAEILSRTGRHVEAIAVLEEVRMDELSAERRQAANALIESSDR